MATAKENIVIHLPILQRSGQRLFSSCAADKLSATKEWFQRVVIGEKLCPFAAPLLKEEGLLRIVSSSADTIQAAVEDVQREVQELVGTPNNDAVQETTLVVMDNNSFARDYLEFVRLSWTLQEKAVGEEYQDKLQLVLFHPLASHHGGYASGPQEDNPADYTIRSPYPTIHLLREEDVLKAVQSGYPDLEYLPTRNKTKLMDQGIDVCKQRLQACYVSAEGKIE